MIASRWTDDPILRVHRFCNTYRILDRVSQYIVREVIEKGPQDPTEVLFRVALFNLFTKIETYELLQNQLGEITWATYDRKAYAHVLAKAKGEGIALYTASFQKPAPNFGHTTAARNHLELLEILVEDLPQQIADAKYMADVFEYLVSLPGESQDGTVFDTRRAEYTPRNG
jgi:hypothetical protein